MKIYYDLHIHSALSPCGSDDMTPNNILNLAMLCGLDVIAISDHNSVGNIETFINVSKQEGFPLVIPAMELTTQDDIHILMLFYTLNDAKECGKYVYDKLIKVKNNIKIFGNQNYLDVNDQTISNEETLLITATQIPTDDVIQLAKKFNAVAVPAHVDKQANSMISVLCEIPKSFNFSTVEISRNCSKEVKQDLINQGYKILHNSDSHYLDTLNIKEGENYLEVSELTIDSILDSIKIF